MVSVHPVAGVDRATVAALVLLDSPVRKLTTCFCLSWPRVLRYRARGVPRYRARAGEVLNRARAGEVLGLELERYWGLELERYWG